MTVAAGRSGVSVTPGSAGRCVGRAGPRPSGDEDERRADNRGEHDGNQLPTIRQRGAHPALEAAHGVGDRGRVLANVDDGEVVQQVDARQHEERGGDEVDVAHRRPQRAEEQLVGSGEAHRQGDHDESHPRAIEHGIGHPGGEPLTPTRAEHRRDEQGHRAAQRRHRVGDAVDEHRPDAAGAPSGVEVRGGEAWPVASEHGDAEPDECRSDDQRGVLGVAQQPGVDRLGDDPDDEEHGDEAGRHRRADDQRPTYRSPLVRGLFGGLDAEEEQQVGRQQYEPARVDRRHHAAQEGQSENVGVDRRDHASNSATCWRSSASLSGPGLSDDLAVGGDEQRHGILHDAQLRHRAGRRGRAAARSRRRARRRSGASRRRRRAG